MDYSEWKYSSRHFSGDITWVLPPGIEGAEDVIRDSITANRDEDNAEVYELNGLLEQMLGLGEDRVFLDLGANVGKYSVLFSKLGWRVYAIEAAEDNYTALMQTSERNGLDLHVLNNIIHEKTGKMYFYSYGAWGMCAPAEDDGIHKSIFFGKEPAEIDSICLDDWRNTGLKDMDHLDFIKMDVEGSEAAVIRGAGNFLEYFGYPMVLCESNKWTLSTQRETPGSLMRVFSDLGYNAYQYRSGRLVRMRGDHRQLRCNTDYLFIHGEPENVRVTSENPVFAIRSVRLGIIMRALSKKNELDRIGTLYALKDDPDVASVPMVRKKVERLLEEGKSNPIYDYLWEIMPISA